MTLHMYICVEENVVVFISLTLNFIDLLFAEMQSNCNLMNNPTHRISIYKIII